MEFFFRDCRAKEKNDEKGRNIFWGQPQSPSQKSRVLTAFVGERPKEEGLLEKMVGAMKFALGEAIVVFSDDPQQCFKEILTASPQVIVSIGAASLNLLLGRRERLSLVHGRVFDCIVQNKEISSEFKLVPIFHPDILAINPSMKRVAWNDLQKVFPLVGRSVIQY